MPRSFLLQDWFAFFGNGSEFNLTLSGEADFPNIVSPIADDNYGFCQEVEFNTTFYASPVVLVSVHHIYNPQVTMKSPVSPKNNIISAWVEEVSLTSMRICVKNLSGTGSKHDPLSVSYNVIGDLNPCLDVFCPSFGVCKTYSAHEARCVCNDNCPSYQDPVCTENGTTYDNECQYKLSFCKGLDNNTLYHSGGCKDICPSGWSYFSGFCHHTSDTCTNWTIAVKECRQENSVLADVNNNEENIYIQHRHNGDKSWLGLNDISTDGDFTWVDRRHGNFTAWAENQPNNLKEEDCAHALGVKHDYEWNDVQCSDCYQFTCKKDLDECENELNYCHKQATSTNERGSYKCKCNAGYLGDGFQCSSFFSAASSCGHRYTSSAFLFSLVNKLGWGPVRLTQQGKYSYYRSDSISSCSDSGPGFGGGLDFYIPSYASSTNSYSNLGYTYSPSSGHSYSSSFTKSFLAGSHIFRPDDIEVFYETT
ncbi:Aggrecan core protein [Stylophora pistillata]|uniref:Aggrecan core protein n=1 Tax=Stylophora pistillata TaxID=50429 RepID=A0A2B4RC29_STYPI|nr:Aggrecan core protein [Stylophora pistillata]